jgi:hypothetical protein
MLGEDLADLLRDCPVDLEAGLHEDQVRALPLCGNRRHGRSDAVLSGFVARRRHDAPLAGPAHGDRLAAKIRIVPLFDRRVKGIHVDVDDLRWRPEGVGRQFQSRRRVFLDAAHLPIGKRPLQPRCAIPRRRFPRLRPASSPASPPHAISIDMSAFRPSGANFMST